MTAIAFVVPGVAAPQGSKVRNRWGGVREDNPNTIPWREAVTAHAVKAMAGRPLIHGPATVKACFYFPRPQGHFRTGRHAGELKPGAPTLCPKKYDLDKLQRAIGDALTGAVLRDDVQIVHWDAQKLYGAPARCLILVAEASEPTTDQEGTR